MKRALLIAGGLMLVSATLHASQASTPATLPEAEVQSSEPGHPVPEPGTMAITSMGLLAAAAFRRKRPSNKS